MNGLLATVLRTVLVLTTLCLFRPATGTAATLTVTNNGDAATGGTLRWALKVAATNGQVDTIAFNLPASTTIAPTGNLPWISELATGLTIDGTTQPGYSGTPIVKLLGTNKAVTEGLVMQAENNTIKGLFITKFPGAGVTFMGGRSNAVKNCYVVSNVADGIYLSSTKFGTVGGTNAADRNVISTNGGNGIYLNGDDCYSNTIAGNYIGTDATGLLPLGNLSDGVLVAAPSNQIGGRIAGARNVICGNGNGGVALASGVAAGNVIEGNYLGVNAGGTSAVPNTSGVRLYNASGNTIGGWAAGSGNVISGNLNYGVHFDGASSSNVVAGNYIGTDASGLLDVGNVLNGVEIGSSATGNRIGDEAAGGGNIISGNNLRGVDVNSCTGAIIQANWIGIGADGSRIANTLDGILLYRSAGVTVGGTNAGAGNVIAGNGNMGLYFDTCGSNAVLSNYIGLNAAGAAVNNTFAGVLAENSRGLTLNDNVIGGNPECGVSLYNTRDSKLARNRIGTDPAGTSARGNGQQGIYVWGGSSNIIIGGTYTNDGNTVCASGDTGIRIIDPSTTAISVKGNRIGCDVNGATSLPNASYGIEISSSSFNSIGSTNGPERNVISGNRSGGVRISFTNAHDNAIIGNYIGTDATGTNALGDRGGAGVAIAQGACGNRVGGFETGAGNRIAFNAGGGIWVENGSSNFLAHNSIFRNMGLGIDLGSVPGLVTLNDHLDADTDGNGLQNFPVLGSVSNNGAQIKVTGSLDSNPSEAFTIELYGCTGPDRTGYGQGERPLTNFTVNTPAGGVVNFTNSFPTPVPPPNFITALAHRSTTHDTSEFSQYIMLDSDGDGMADGYEYTYFGGITNGVAGADGDFDGCSNLAEFLADSDPTDSNSVRRITGLSISGTSFAIVAPASPERVYTLQSCTNLAATPQIWDVKSAYETRTLDQITLNGTSVSNAAHFRLRAKLP